MWCRKTRKPQTFLIKCPWSSLRQSEKLHFLPSSVLVYVIDLAGWAPLWEPPLMVGIISRFVWAMENKWPSEEESWQIQPSPSSYEFISLAGSSIAHQPAIHHSAAVWATEKQSENNNDFHVKELFTTALAIKYQFSTEKVSYSY